MKAKFKMDRLTHETLIDSLEKTREVIEGNFDVITEMLLSEPNAVIADSDVIQWHVNNLKKALYTEIDQNAVKEKFTDPCNYLINEFKNNYKENEFFDVDLLDYKNLLLLVLDGYIRILIGQTVDELRRLLEYVKSEDASLTDYDMLRGLESDFNHQLFGMSANASYGVYSDKVSNKVLVAYDLYKIIDFEATHSKDGDIFRPEKPWKRSKDTEYLPELKLPIVGTLNKVSDAEDAVKVLKELGAQVKKYDDSDEFWVRLESNDRDLWGAVRKGYSYTVKYNGDTIMEKEREE